MTTAELRNIGERLYGPRWQTKPARAFAGLDPNQSLLALRGTGGCGGGDCRW